MNPATLSLLRVSVEGQGYVGFVDIHPGTTLRALREALALALDAGSLPQHYVFVQPSGVLVGTRHERRLAARDFLPELRLAPTAESPLALRACVSLWSGAASFACWALPASCTVAQLRSEACRFWRLSPADTLLTDGEGGLWPDGGRAWGEGAVFVLRMRDARMERALAHTAFASQDCEEEAEAEAARAGERLEGRPRLPSCGGDEGESFATPSPPDSGEEEGRSPREAAARRRAPAQPASPGAAEAPRTALSRLLRAFPMEPAELSDCAAALHAESAAAAAQGSGGGGGGGGEGEASHRSAAPQEELLRRLGDVLAEREGELWSIFTHYAAVRGGGKEGARRRRARGVLAVCARGAALCGWPAQGPALISTCTPTHMQAGDRGDPFRMRARQWRCLLSDCGLLGVWEGWWWLVDARACERTWVAAASVLQATCCGPACRAPCARV